MLKQRIYFGFVLFFSSFFLASGYFFSCIKKDPENTGITPEPTLPADSCKNVDTFQIFAAVELDLASLSACDILDPLKPCATFDQKGNLSMLSYSGFDQPKLTTLPEKIGCASALTILQLPYNQLANLPESMGDLLQLKTLDLKYNFLTTLPDTFAHSKQLKTLNLENNNFKDFPLVLLALENLETLYFCGENMNRTMDIPQEITTLKKLDRLCLPLLPLPHRIVLEKQLKQTHPNLILQFR